MTIRRSSWIAITLICLAQVGCCLNRDKLEFCDDGCYNDALVEQYSGQGLKPETPYLDDCIHQEWVEPVSPLQLSEGTKSYADAFAEYGRDNYTHLTLEECIQRALLNSKVMRDLGGTILRNPDNQTTVFDPSAAYTNPQFGEEAALSAFDANIYASAFFDYNDRAFNNSFFGQQGLLVQELGDYRWGISKQAATGTLFNVRNVINRENNNQLGNIFGTPSSAYDTYVEAEARQPLLQGAGVLFNRINGTSQDPGSANGVLIARANTDISLAQFEQGVRDLVSDVENSYWDLYFAYRDLDAKIDARDAAYRTWEQVKTRLIGESGTSPEENQAREQLFRFEAEVIDALYGRLVDGTRTNNGSGSGTFRSNGGVRVAERRLRLIMGSQLNDLEGKLIKPSDAPSTPKIKFDWNECTREAFAHRAELREQKWKVKQQELELIASKNYLLPRLDAVGRYRLRGFGSEYWSNDGEFNVGDTSASAVSDMFGLDRQEWQVGLEFSMPIGFRRAHAAVRNAELALTRESAILREQEREVMFGLSNAVADVDRAFNVLRAQYNRLAAAVSQEDSIHELYDTGQKGSTTLDVLLEAQRRVADAKIRFHQAEVEYMLAIKNVHFEKGTLLEYCNVLMTESMWPAKAYRDARERDCLQGDYLDYTCRDKVLVPGDQQFHSMHPTTETYIIEESTGDLPLEMETGSNNYWSPEYNQGQFTPVGSQESQLFPTTYNQPRQQTPVGSAAPAAGILQELPPTSLPAPVRDSQPKPNNDPATYFSLSDN